MAAMLVFQNKEMAATMVYQANPPGTFMQILSLVSVIQYVSENAPYHSL